MSASDEAEAGVEAIASREMEALARTLREGSELVLIALRFHTYCEWLLDRLVSGYLPKGSTLLERSSLRFQQKLELVNALDLLPDSAVGSLRIFSKIRNQFSHAQEATFGESELDQIGQPSISQYQDLKERAGGDLRRLSQSVFFMIAEPVLAKVVAAENPDLVEDS